MLQIEKAKLEELKLSFEKKKSAGDAKSASHTANVEEGRHGNAERGSGSRRVLSASPERARPHSRESTPQLGRGKRSANFESSSGPATSADATDAIKDKLDAITKKTRSP